MPDRPVYVDSAPVSLRAVPAAQQPAAGPATVAPPAGASVQVAAAPAAPHRAEVGLAEAGPAAEMAAARDRSARTVPGWRRADRPVDAGGVDERVGAGAVAVVSLKGGVGRTTVALGVAWAVAEHGPGSVAAVDVDPYGDLADRGGVASTCTVRDLVAVTGTRQEVAAMAGRPPGGRLDVIAGDDAMSPNDVGGVLAAMAARYDSVVVDTAPGLATSRMAAAVGACPRVVVVTTTAFDAADAAWRTFDWLDEAGVAADRVVTAVVGLPPAVTEALSLPRLVPHLRSRGRAVVAVPWSAELAAGRRLRFDGLEPAVTAAFTDLAELVAGPGPAVTGEAGSARW